MEGDVAEHRAERVFAPGGGARQFYGLGDGSAERALVVGIDGENVFAGTCRHGRRRRHLRAEGLHHAAAVGLLLVAELDLIDSGLQAEQPGCVCQRCTPLAGAGLGGDVCHAFFAAVVGLRKRRVELVRTHGAHALVLEIYVGGSAERLFKPVSAHEGSGTVVFVHLAHFLGNVNPAVGLVEFLATKLLGEDGIEVFGLEGFVRGGIQRRHGLVGHVGLYVVPLAWYFLFGKEISLFLFAHNYCVFAEKS